MLDSIRAFVAHVWSWCLATPANAVFALAVLGFVANVATRFFTSKEWAAWCEKHPRVVGLFLIAKGAFPEGGTIARGFWAAVTGELRQRAREALPKTEEKPKGPPTIPPIAGMMIGALLFALLLPGCPGASSPTDRPTARSYVLLVADGVKLADVACAEAAHVLATSDRAKALTVADACAHGYTVARQALLTAEAALDAYDSGGAGRWGCALRDGLGGLRELAAGIALAGAKVPDSVADGLALASTLSGLACSPAPDAAVGG